MLQHFKDDILSVAPQTGKKVSKDKSDPFYDIFTHNLRAWLTLSLKFSRICLSRKGLQRSAAFKKA